MNKCVLYLYVEASNEIACDLHQIVLKCLVWWTCHSEDVCAGLSRTGLITKICNLLRIYIQLNIYDKVRRNIIMH